MPDSIRNATTSKDGRKGDAILKDGIILNPNCSSIVCSLPSSGTMAEANLMIKKLMESNISKKSKERMKQILTDWSYQEWIDVRTDDYPNDAIERFMYLTKNLSKMIHHIKEFPELQIVEQTDGDYDYMEASYGIAKLYALGKLTKEEAAEFDRRIWEGGRDPELETTCDQCLHEKKIETECKEYVKRMVGECKGRFKKTEYDVLADKMTEVEKSESTVKSKL